MVGTPSVLTLLASASEQFSRRRTQEVNGYRTQMTWRDVSYIEKPLFSKELGSHARE